MTAKGSVPCKELRWDIQHAPGPYRSRNLGARTRCGAHHHTRCISVTSFVWREGPSGCLQRQPLYDLSVWTEPVELTAGRGETSLRPTRISYKQSRQSCHATLQLHAEGYSQPPTAGLESQRRSRCSTESGQPTSPMMSLLVEYDAASPCIYQLSSCVGTNIRLSEFRTQNYH